MDDSNRRTGVMVLGGCAILELIGLGLLLLGMGVITEGENMVFTGLGAGLFMVANAGIVGAVMMMRR